jgi:hypothetical protein
MTEVETLRAEIEAIKLICMCLLQNMPAHERSSAMHDIAKTASLYSDRLLFQPMPDAQREHMNTVIRALSEPPRAPGSPQGA